MLTNGGDMKAAIVVDQSLPTGLKSNCGAVLGVSLGALHPEIVGPDLHDAGGGFHHGITGLPIPVLSATGGLIAEIVDRSRGSEETKVIAFNNIAQSCTSYDEYEKQLAATKREDLSYLAVLIVGTKRGVNRLAGSLPLVR